MRGGSNGGAIARPRASPPQHGRVLTPLQQQKLASLVKNHNEIEQDLAKMNEQMLGIIHQFSNYAAAAAGTDTNEMRGILNKVNAAKALIQKTAPQNSARRTRSTTAQSPTQVSEVPATRPPARRKRSTTVASPTPVLPPAKVAGADDSPGTTHGTPQLGGRSMSSAVQRTG